MKKEMNTLEGKRKMLESSIVSHKFSQLSHNQDTHSSFSAQTCSASSWEKLLTFRNKQVLRHGSGSKRQFQSGDQQGGGRGSGSPRLRRSHGGQHTRFRSFQYHHRDKATSAHLHTDAGSAFNKGPLMIWIISINFLGNWLPNQQKDIFLMIQRNAAEEFPQTVINSI